MTESIKPRIYKYDNVRLLAITLVVIGSFAEEFTSHSDMFQSWFIFVYSFHAPLFIFLSGLFQKQYQDGVKLNIRRITTYLILGFVLKIAIYLLRLSNGEDIGLDLLGGATMEWYLFVICMYMVTLYLLKGVHRYVLLTVSVILGIGAGFFPLGDELYLMRYFVFMPFYVAGYYLTPVRVRKFTHRINVKLAGIVFMFIYFVLCFRERDIIYPLRTLFTGRNPYSLVPIPGCTFYHRMLCYGISAVLIISILACIPNRKVPLLTHMGRNTLGVYFWHYPLVLALWHFGVMDMLTQLGDPMWKLTFLAIAVVCTLILSIGVFTWPLKKLDSAMGSIPRKVCVGIDLAILAGAIIANNLIP